MLTLRDPIQLNISDSLCTMTDAFYERITGSYGALQADITPKELLFCLSTPYELPDELGGLTTVAVSNRYTDKRTVTMELVSNVINRILLSTTPQFTYQDQVYIDTVLYKLGVSDVPLFMKQVQKLSDEHLSVERLVALYREELAQRAETTGAAESPVPAGSEPPAAAEAPSGRPRYFLQNEIYDRLQTRELYERVNSFQSDHSHTVSEFRRNELKTSEQFSVSRLLELSALRERVTEVPRMDLHHTVNRFELGDLLPEPQNAEQVLSQAAEAALLSSFEHVYTQCLAKSFERAPVWLRLERSLSETVESSVNRFQSFHSENSFFFSDSVRGPVGLERFREESSVLRELVKSRTELGGAMELTRRLRETAAVPPILLEHPPIEAQGELVDENETERVETHNETRTERDIASLTREILEHGAAPAAPAAQKPLPAPPVERSFRTVREIELENEVRQHTDRLRETLARQFTENTETLLQSAVERAGTENVTETLRELRERAEHTASETRSQETLRETTMQNPPLPAAEETPGLPGGESAAAPGAETRPGTGPVRETVESVKTLERELREAGAPGSEHFEALEIEHRRTLEKQTAETEHERTVETTGQLPGERETVLRESTAERTVERTAQTPPVPGENAGENTVSETLRELRERTERSASQIRTQETLRETALQNPPAAPAETETPALPGTVPETVQPAAQQPPGTVPGETTETFQTLEKQLREVDERNREHFEALQIEHLHTTETQIPQTDIQKTFDVSKRALESPETVLRELRENAEKTGRSETLPPEAELQLRRADPQTRAVLEAVLRRSAGASADETGPQLREGGPGELNAAALETVRAGAREAEPVFSEVDKTLATERTQTLLERIAEPAVHAAIEQAMPAPPKKLSLVHKREQELFTDEFLERLENRQSRKTEETTTLETQTDRRIEEFTRTGTTTQINAETTQDVTELVNRTLARQMNEISDKVYRQMEKKLQTERSRRGRY